MVVVLYCEDDKDLTDSSFYLSMLTDNDDDDQSKHSQDSEGSKGESLHSETRSVESGDVGDSDIDAAEEGSSPLKRKLPKVPTAGKCQPI